MQALLDLLDGGGLSLAAAAAKLGLSEGQALASLAEAGRSTKVEAGRAMTAVRTWGRVRVIVRSQTCMAEVMCDLGAVREGGGWWNHEGDDVHLHLDLRDVSAAFVTTKAGHATGRAVRNVAFVERSGEVLFKVMVPKDRADLLAAFQALQEAT